MTSSTTWSQWGAYDFTLVTEEDSSLLSRPNYYTSTQHEVGFKQLLANAGKPATTMYDFNYCDGGAAAASS